MTIHLLFFLFLLLPTAHSWSPQHLSSHMGSSSQLPSQAVSFLSHNYSLSPMGEEGHSLYLTNELPDCSSGWRESRKSLTIVLCEPGEPKSSDLVSLRSLAYAVRKWRLKAVYLFFLHGEGYEEERKNQITEAFQFAGEQTEEDYKEIRNVVQLFELAQEWHEEISPRNKKKQQSTPTNANTAQQHSQQILVQMIPLLQTSYLSPLMYNNLLKSFSLWFHIAHYSCSPELFLPLLPFALPPPSPFGHFHRTRGILPPSTHVLVTQLDVFLSPSTRSKNIQDFLKYNYLGCPGLVAKFPDRCNAPELQYKDHIDNKYCAIVGGLSLRSLNSTLLALLARQQAMFYPTPISLSKPTSPSPPSFSSSSFSSSFLFPKSSSSPSPPFSSFRSPSSPSLTEDPIPEDFFFFSAIYSQLPIVNYPNDPLVQSFCSQRTNPNLPPLGIHKFPGPNSGKIKKHTKKRTYLSLDRSYSPRGFSTRGKELIQKWKTETHNGERREKKEI